MKETVLLMFSGGLDSTGVFWELLKTNEILHVHHLHLKNVENRTEAENKAVNNILEYMRKIKDFTYSESKHEYESYNGKFIWDCDIMSFMAGFICDAKPSIKNVAIGLTKTDISSSVNARIEKANKIFSAFCKATKIYPVKHLTKKEVWDLLPDDLRQLTWSCRTPIYKDNEIIPCNRCKTCFEMKKNGLLHGKFA